MTDTPEEQLPASRPQPEISQNSEIAQTPHVNSLNDDKDGDNRVKREYRAKRPCGAKTSSGEPCRKPAVTGRNRCRTHGGKSYAAGPLHPAHKGGVSSIDRRNRHFPPAVAELVKEAHADRDLLSIRETVAIFQARSFQLRERLGTGESGAAWSKLSKLWSQFEEANVQSASAARDKQSAVDDINRADAQRRLDAASSQATAALKGIGQIVNSEDHNEDAWKELLELEGTATNVRKEEIGRLTKLKTLITAEQMLSVAHSLQVAIGEVISDRTQRKLIGQKFAAIMNFPPEAGHVREVVGDPDEPSVSEETRQMSSDAYGRIIEGLAETVAPDSEEE